MITVFRKKALWAAVILAMCISTGCARQHYFTVQTNSIVFYYQNSDAKEVLFASSIDRFTLHPAEHVEHGLWRVTVPNKENFSYFYLVDKVPQTPACELTVVDDFGARNCLFDLKM